MVIWYNLLQGKIKYKGIKSSYGWEFHWFPYLVNTSVYVNLFSQASVIVTESDFHIGILCLIYHKTLNNGRIIFLKQLEKFLLYRFQDLIPWHPITQFYTCVFILFYKNMLDYDYYSSCENLIQVWDFHSLCDLQRRTKFRTLSNI